MLTKNSKALFHNFRMVGIAEGISFLILLIIAMPLKYFFNYPQAVKFVGWGHGLLFVIYIYLAFAVFTSFKRPFGWLFKAGIAALFPFGTFIFDKSLKKEELTL